jgi:4-amino-4-deoxy-L-arabinose transferase-like glycosyltransferase
VPVALSRGPDGRWRAGLAAILLAAALARAAWLLATPHFALFGDPADYERWAASLATGHGFPATAIASPGTPSAFRPPGYPLLLGGLYAVVGTHPQAGRVLGALLGVLAVGLLALLGRRLGGDRLGFWAGALAAVFPPLVAISGTLLSEALFLPLELGLALMLLAVRSRPSVRRAAIAGALLAAAVLTRAVAVPWVLVAVAALLRSSGRARCAAALAVAFLVVMAPWTIRNGEALHAFVPVSTEGGYTLAGQYNATVAAPGPLQSVWQIPTIVPSVAARIRALYARPGGVDEAQIDGALRHVAGRYISAHPGYVLRAAANDALRMVDLGPGHRLQSAIVDRELALPAGLRAVTRLCGQALVALALAGFVLGLRRRRLGPWWLWAMPVVALLATVVVVGGTLKRAPLDPFLILLAAHSVDAAVQWAQRLRRGRR